MAGVARGVCDASASSASAVLRSASPRARGEMWANWSHVFVFDRRRTSEGDGSEKVLDVTGVKLFREFRSLVAQLFHIGSEDSFVITTTSRKEIKDDKSFEQGVLGCHGDLTLYVLSSVEQELPAQACERIDFLPHYDTLVKSGMYEYYASEGQNPLPYAFAELIDNALAATAGNSAREIVVRLLFDETQGRPAVVVTDNGCGMTPRQLNNWAVYRLSKFTRHDPDASDGGSGYKPPVEVTRSINSDISCFGVGGKQAVFYIGHCTRMISKAASSTDVHELCLSKEDFERKERSNEAIYSSYIRNRMPGDSSHVSADDDHFLRSLIAEEKGKPSFTNVVVTGIALPHIHYLKASFHTWTRQLAHIYHYYIHGSRGNELPTAKLAAKRHVASNINIKIALYERQRALKVVNLREVTDDMQTQYVRTACDTFEFRARESGNLGSSIEGVIRYHPFLYDHETYPKDIALTRNEPLMDEEDYDVFMLNPTPQSKRPMFECYWNGRLIPYTTIQDFEWCERPKKYGSVPPECYNRISGCLFSNDRLQVSTNKLTFMDLAIRLKSKDTIFTRLVNGQEQRARIEREFLQWLRDCHERYDKQVKFSGFCCTLTRSDVPKRMQTPWAVFSRIEWDGRLFNTGDLVKTIKTQPIYYGKIQRFLLYGDHEKDVYATGGEMEISQEPRELYSELRVVPLSKLDRTASISQIKKCIDDEMAKFPDKFLVTWPEGGEVTESDKRPAGTPIGPLRVEILNRRGDPMQKLPGGGQTSTRKLLVELKILFHSTSGDKEIVSHISQHGGSKWPFWFKKMENLNKRGKYTLRLQVLNESNGNMFSGHQLPSEAIHFTVTEAKPDKFTVGFLESPFLIGTPFNIPLDMKDEFGHDSCPPMGLKPILEAAGLELSYDSTVIRGTTLLLKGVTAKGTVHHCQGKNFNLKVTVPNLKESTQMLKIRLLPGPPSMLRVKPEAELLLVENGTALHFTVDIMDKAGNVSSLPKLIIQSKFEGAPGLPVYMADCSNASSATLTGPPIHIASLKEDKIITAFISIQNNKEVPPVERKVKLQPSSRAASIQIFNLGNNRATLIRPADEINWPAGEHLRNLLYKLYDEGDREIMVNATLVSKMRVTWTPKVNRELLMQGLLPDVKVPTLASEPKYCQIFFQDDNNTLETSFTIRAIPDEPKNLRVTLKGLPIIQLDEMLSAEILVEVTDQFGNTVMSSGFATALNVSAKGLDLSTLNMSWQECSGSVLVKGIRFQLGPLGPRDILFSLKDLKEHLIVTLDAGQPATLQLLPWHDTQKPITVYNYSSLEKPLTVQLCDKWGNPCQQPNVRVQLITPHSLKLSPAATTQKTNKQGKAEFGVLQVNAPCGDFTLQLKAHVGKQVLEGPKILLSVLPDPNKATQLLVDFNKLVQHTVGGILTDLMVQVLAEDGKLMKNVTPNNLSMKIWNADTKVSPKSPSKSITFQCNMPQAGDKEGHFYFRNKVLPEVTGMYNIEFIYTHDKTMLKGMLVTLEVKPGPPERLQPDVTPATLTVSNSRSLDSRTLLRAVTLRLTDQFGNPTGCDLDGEVEVTIEGSEEKTEEKTEGEERPLFIGHKPSVQVPLTAGVAKIQSLVLAEDTPGHDSAKYVLCFEVRGEALPKEPPVQPYRLPFMFYNDGKKQQEMAALSKQRDQLSSIVGKMRSMLEIKEKLVKELKVGQREAATKEQKLRADLRKQKVPDMQLNTVEVVDELMGSLKERHELLVQQPRRTCTLPPYPRVDQEILGKLGHLALIEDDEVARVLSWHMSGDMDCLLTLTTEAAQRIYVETNGQQQLLPLSSIFRRNLSAWNKPLPHMINGRPWFNVEGNPVYARHLLIFPKHQQQCQIVFSQLLGDAIILDSLDTANRYRQEVVKSMFCPTLLTRNGERIRSNGKFGGQQNHAPLLAKLRGAVFGAPLPAECQELSSQIGYLQELRSAIEQHNDVQRELRSHVDEMRSPQMKQQQAELRDSEQKLRSLEHKIGMTPQRPGLKAGMPVTLDHRGSYISTGGNGLDSATPSTPLTHRRGRREAARRSGSDNGTSSSPDTPIRSKRRKL
ncbi:unnamed protein product [Lampetra planeri]